MTECNSRLDDVTGVVIMYYSGTTVLYYYNKWKMIRDDKLFCNSIDFDINVYEGVAQKMINW